MFIFLDDVLNALKKIPKFSTQDILVQHVPKNRASTPGINTEIRRSCRCQRQTVACSIMAGSWGVWLICYCFQKHWKSPRSSRGGCRHVMRSWLYPCRAPRRSSRRRRRRRRWLRSCSLPPVPTAPAWQTAPRWRMRRRLRRRCAWRTAAAATPAAWAAAARPALRPASRTSATTT